MSYCSNCGNELSPYDSRCSKCGEPTSNKPVASGDDTGSFGWGLLGFCFPIVGLILYIVWKDTKPLNAGIAGKGALIGFILGLISGFLQVALLGGM